MGPNAAVAVRRRIPDRHRRRHMVQHALNEALERSGKSILIVAIQERIGSRFIQQGDVKVRATARQSLVRLGHEGCEQAVLGEVFLDRALEHERAVGGGYAVERGIVDFDLSRAVFDVVGDDVDALRLQHLDQFIDRRHLMRSGGDEDRLASEDRLARFGIDHVELIFVTHLHRVAE